MLKRLMRVVRDLRWRRLNWSSASDEAFHDQLFAAQAYDPFSHAYPGNITIRRFADLAATHVDARGTVLDLGCGPGEITCELARRFPGATFIGVDHSVEAIRRATANAARLGLANISFVAASLQTYEPPSSVQLVTMFDSFHHLLEPRAFVERFRPLTERFFLIEPAGNALGQWRESSDFDWVAVELDAIREKLDRIWGIAPHAGETAAAPEMTGGEPVERRYTQDDFEAFFDGFSLTVTGTTSGLVSYPPSPQHRSEWRDRFGRHAYEIFAALDDRLVKEGRDLWSRHWAIVAVPGPRAARRPPEGHPLKPTREVVRGGYSIEYPGLRRSGQRAGRHDRRGHHRDSQHRLGHVVERGGRASERQLSMADGAGIAGADRPAAAGAAAQPLARRGGGRRPRLPDPASAREGTCSPSTS